MQPLSKALLFTLIGTYGTLSAEKITYKGSIKLRDIFTHRKRIMGNKVTHERVYYISSLTPDQPVLIADEARSH